MGAEIPEILYASNMAEALDMATKGFEPVECAFGREGSAVGRYKLDHHGQYSGEEAVSVKAARLALEGVKLQRFVVTGDADCDQCYAIAALSGSQIPIDMDEANAIAEVDVDPIGRDLASDRYVRILLFNQRTHGFPSCLDSTYKALGEFVGIFNGRYGAKDVDAARSYEKARKDSVRQGIKQLEPGRVALVASDDWGFDVWYESAPIVVAFVAPKKSVTIGLCPKKGGTLGDRTGFELLGPEGLKRVYPVLDSEIKPGWGGRETIGGSPRNAEMTYEDAQKAFAIIKEIAGN